MFWNELKAQFSQIPWLAVMWGSIVYLASGWYFGDGGDWRGLIGIGIGAALALVLIAAQRTFLPSVGHWSTARRVLATVAVLVAISLVALFFKARREREIAGFEEQVQLLEQPAMEGC